MNDHEDESSGVENELFEAPKSCTFRGKKNMASKNHGKICFSSNDATEMLIDLWSEITIHFALESSKTSKEREKGIARFR